MRFRLLFAVMVLIASANVFAQKADKERLESIVTTLASDEYRGRGFGSPEGVMSADYIISEFEKYGVKPFFETYRQAFNYRQGIINIDGNNIVAWVEGSDPKLKEEYIVLGAHYDHLGWKYEGDEVVVYNGADDNASGVAGVLELGRIFMENRDLLGRSVILIAFDGEESGLIGSNYFVEEEILSDDGKLSDGEVVAMFSLDMIGMPESNEGVALGGVEMIEDYEELIAIASEKTGYKVTKTNGSIPNRTDTDAFGNAGIPCIHMNTGFNNSPYHKPEDDSDLLEYGGMAELVDFTVSFVEELSKLQEIKKVKELEILEEKGGKLDRFHAGFTMHIGSQHHDFEDYYATAKTVFTPAVGVNMEIRLSDMFAFQPEVVYEYGGSQILDGKIRTHSVVTPVSLLLTSPDEGHGVRSYVQIGGYYRYVFSGRDNDGALDLVNDYNQNDYGIGFGAGMEIKNLRIGYYFQKSLVDFSLTDPLDARIVGSYFKMGWMF